MFHNRTLVYCPRCSLLTEQSMLRSTCASTNPSVSAWGGGSTAILLLGLRKLINGDQAGLGPTLLGLTLGAAGFYFGASKRDTFLGM